MIRPILRPLLLVVAVGAAAGPAAAVTLTRIGRFSSPTFVTAPAGDAARVFVVERRGVIRVMVAGKLQPRPFLDISQSVTVTRHPDDERGLLSMAFAPDYATSGRFYVYRVAPRHGPPRSGAIVVDEYRSSGADAAAADPATRRTILRIPAGQNHFGGQLAFGPDGKLWLAPGDGWRRGDPRHNGQNRRALLGKLLRIDPTGPSLAPADNPFAGGGGNPLVWSYGLRNPYRFSFDRSTGDLVIADVGQNFAEEIDFASRGAGLGKAANYGWSVLEGTFRYRQATPLRLRPATRRQVPPGAVRPVIQHVHTRGGWCSVIGGYVVRDPRLPGLAGRYVYGDFCRSAINSAVLSAGQAHDVRPTGLKVRQLVSFGEDGCGRVYAVSLAGPVYRLGGAGGCAGAAPVPFALAARGGGTVSTSRRPV